MSEPSVPFGQRVLYVVVRNVLVALGRVFFRLRVVGAEHVPASGPFILAPVHRDNIDTPMVSGVTRRRMRFMGKDAMWKYAWSAWFFDSMGGIAVRRDTPDREALRQCQEVLAGGEPLVMFPEGTRQVGPLVGELFDGVAFVALRAGVPIVPVGIGGSEGVQPKGSKRLRLHKIVVVIGAPIEVSPPAPGARIPRRAVSDLTDRLRTDLQTLFDEAQVLAGR